MRGNVFLVKTSDGYWLLRSIRLPGGFGQELCYGPDEERMPPKDGRAYFAPIEDEV